jgi:hypothetical protein
MLGLLLKRMRFLAKCAVAAGLATEVGGSRPLSAPVRRCSSAGRERQRPWSADPNLQAKMPVCKVAAFEDLQSTALGGRELQVLRDPTASLPGGGTTRRAGIDGCLLASSTSFARGVEAPRSNPC